MKAMKQRYFKYWHLIITGIVIISIGSCKKDNFLDVPDKGALTNESTFSSQGNADLFINDIYNQLPDGNNAYDQLTDAYADNSFCGAAWEGGQGTVRAGAISPSN